MITRKRFDFLKEKYGKHASWAVWADAGERPKSNIGDMKSEKFELVSKIYDGALHLFDSPFAPDRCRRIRVSRNSPYSSYELCYRYDAQAHDQSKKDIKAFLARHIGN